MKLSTAKRRINKTLDELCKSVVDDWYANFKNGYIKGYEDARQGKSPMYAEAYKVADTPLTDMDEDIVRSYGFKVESYRQAKAKDEPQTDNGIGCSRCESRYDCYDRNMPHAVRCNNYGKITDEPQTVCGWK